MQKLLLALTLIVLTPFLANASVIGLDIKEPGTAGPTSNFEKGTLGWKFSLSESVVLTALGTWDQDSNGLNNDQTINIWQSDGKFLNPEYNKLTSATVFAGENSAISKVSSASGAGEWLFVDVTEIILSAGDYIVGADIFSGLDLWQQNVSADNVTTDSRLTWLEARSRNNSFGLPGSLPTGVGANGLFGPNLMFKSVSVPEPGTVALMTVGLAGLMVSRRRRTSLQ